MNSTAPKLKRAIKGGTPSSTQESAGRRRVGRQAASVARKQGRRGPRQAHATTKRRVAMSDQNLTYTFTVDQTPEEAFAAINNVRGWWSGEIEGSTDKLGDVWSYRYKDIHYSKHEITEFVPEKKVVWLVVDGFLNFVEDKSEWKGTKITFEIARKGGKTEVRFTHVGLVPDHECFSLCSNAWGTYINGSLRSLITTGKGRPNAKE
jgi:hypothetical protein